MKNRILLLIAIGVIGLTLTACSSSSVASAQGQADASASQMSDSQRLAVGTLRLEDTELAVDAAQAAELLPLWKAAQSLSTSQTISTVEMDALYAQIRAALTAEQIKAINAMDFTAAEITEMESSLGVGMEVASVDTAGISAQSGGQPGAPADGMGAPPDAAGMPSDSDLTEIAPPSGDTSGVGPYTSQVAVKSANANMFIAPLIELLKSKAMV
jgi:hypothetical protein